MRALASLGEWFAAGLALIGLFWLMSGPAQDFFGSAGPLTSSSAVILPSTPPGIPLGATSVPLLVLLDGTEIRVGSTQSALNAVLSERLADGPANVSRGSYGDRITRAYKHGHTRFYVACERVEPGGAMMVTGVYLP